MKKLLLPLFAFCLFVGAINAQDAATALKEAKKAMTKYNVESDITKKAEILTTARQNIDIATQNANSFDEKEAYNLWKLDADIYNASSESYINNKFINPDFQSDNAKSAFVANKALFQALKLATKKWQTNEVLSELLENASLLSNSGRLLYGDKDFTGAYEAFQLVIDTRKLLLENGNDKLLPDENEYNEHLYMTALSALISENKPVAQGLFKQLYDAKFAKPAVYEGLYQTMVEADEAGALKVLADGRAAFPDDEGLLVAEINHYIFAGKLDELTDKLKAAIAKDPENVTFYSTLGKVYDDLYQREEEAGNATKSAEYFEEAQSYYNQALAKDPEFFNAIYNLGALYFNKAALLNKQMIELSNDLSKEGTKKYNTKKTEVYAMFDKALPYFTKAEKIDPNDVSTLIALKEIFARKDDLTTSNEFKNRIETIQGGGKIEASWFQNK